MNDYPPLEELAKISNRVYNMAKGLPMEKVYDVAGDHVCMRAGAIGQAFTDSWSRFITDNRMLPGFRGRLASQLVSEGNTTW